MQVVVALAEDQKVVEAGVGDGAEEAEEAKEAKVEVASAEFPVAVVTAAEARAEEAQGTEGTEAAAEAASAVTALVAEETAEMGQALAAWAEVASDVGLVAFQEVAGAVTGSAREMVGMGAEEAASVMDKRGASRGAVAARAVRKGFGREAVAVEVMWAGAQRALGMVARGKEEEAQAWAVTAMVTVVGMRGRVVVGKAPVAEAAARAEVVETTAGKHTECRHRWN